MPLAEAFTEALWWIDTKMSAFNRPVIAPRSSSGTNTSQSRVIATRNPRRRNSAASRRARSRLSSFSCVNAPRAPGSSPPWPGSINTERTAAGLSPLQIPGSRTTRSPASDDGGGEGFAGGVEASGLAAGADLSCFGSTGKGASEGAHPAATNSSVAEAMKRLNHFI